MKRFLTAVALSLALSSAALAGDIPSVGIHAAPTGTTTTAPSPGDIPTVPSDSSLGVSDVFYLLQTVFGLM